MKANELRIGNWVEIIQANKGVFTTIQGSSLTVDIKTHFKEIPLTEKWLLKFGFGKSDEHEMGNNSNDNFGFYYDYHFNKFRLETNESSGLNSADIYLDIKYVHQLQNLYFALTGEELNYENETK